jgi:hypothetical protein
MRRRFICAPALALLLVATGCGRLVVDHVVTGRPAAPHTGPVAVIMETDPPPANFAEIALVRAHGSGTKANLQTVIEGLQEEARKVGANAVVRVRIDQGSGSVSAIGTAGTAW